MSAPAWYCETDGGSLGPLAASELKELARSGELKPTDRVRKEGMTSWATAAQVKGLFASQETASPPGGCLQFRLRSLLCIRRPFPAQDPNPPQRPTGDPVRPNRRRHGNNKCF